MRTLRSRLEAQLDIWHSADEFSESDKANYLDALENAVKNWLRDGAKDMGILPRD